MSQVSLSYDSSLPDRNTVLLNQVQVGIASKVWHVVSKIIDFLASAISHFQQVSHDRDVKDVNLDFCPAIDKLQHKRTLSNDTVEKYCKYLIETKVENFELINLFLFERTKKSLNENWTRTDGYEPSNLVFIPVVFKGFIRNHIAAVIYDRWTRRIEYYDSKGVAIAERGNDTIIGSDITITDLLKELKQRTGAETLVENTYKHQYDSHNCGVYVLRYLERRLEGEEPNDIFQSGESFWDINSTMRRKMINNLADQYPRDDHDGEVIDVEDKDGFVVC